MLFLRKTLPILLVAFLLSVAVRLPQLGRPLSKHHEFCTAVTLRVLQVWWDNGIENYHYNPVMTYNNEADKFINNFANATGKVVDEEGNFYYVSHPPFAYYFPYLVFKLIHVRPDVVSLQIFNYFLHFLSALFVYFIVCLLSFNRARSHLHVSSFIAFLFYLFSPATMWFQGNVYMSDMAVQTVFVIGVYVALKMIIRRKFFVPKYVFFYVVILFLMLYTSWLGVFFALGVVVYSLLHVKQEKGFRMLLWSTILVSIFALRLVEFQYAQIAGDFALSIEWFNRYLIRGSIGNRGDGYFSFLVSYFIYLKNIFFNYLVNYFIYYILIVAFVWLGISKAKLKIVFSENGYRFIWLSVLPIVLLHFIFLNYSAHDFTVLYASLFFAVLIGILYDKVKKAGVISDVKLNVMVLITLILLVVQYTVSNLPGPKNYKGEAYASDKILGEYIAKNSNKDEVLFVYDKPEPQVNFYAGRNLRVVKSEAEAIAFLKTRKLTKGKIFTTSGSNITSMQIADTTTVEQ